MNSIEEITVEIQDKLDRLADYYGIKSKALIAMQDGTICELTGRADSPAHQGQAKVYSRNLH